VYDHLPVAKLNERKKWVRVENISVLLKSSKTLGSNFLGQGGVYKTSRNNNFLVNLGYLYPT